MHVEIKPRNRIQQVNSSCTCGQKREIDFSFKKGPHVAFINGKRKPITIQSVHVSEAKQLKGQTLLALGLTRWGPF